MKFDPFNNRVCRDIRNGLSKGLMDALRNKDLKAVHTLAAKYLAQGVEPYQKKYIEGRLGGYEKVLAGIRRLDPDDVYDIALKLWDAELFYEVHEYLEFYWKQASGANREILQALIRAAGTYIHLEQGNVKGAANMAAKAVKILEKKVSRALLPGYLDLGLLLVKLRNLDPVAPKLIRRI
ncbi:MAG: DUF309 domain-containing protein [Proteobacteria bacterium]|nr:DUF309 domain-containing protein [Pseudomonadota bacterium]MBU1738156.1 DUF309 domain-containing protein [Pseudomonadota bacterium]